MRFEEDDHREDTSPTLPSAAHNPEPRYLDRAAVLKKTGMTRDELAWALERKRFPQPDRLCPPRWARLRIELYLQSRRASV